MRKPLVVVREITVPIAGPSAGLVGTRLAHVSDFHFRRWNRVFQEAQDLLLSLDYDLLIATGDFGTNPRRWNRVAPFVDRFFAPIAVRTPIFGSLGNHDGAGLADIQDLPIKLLRNESTVIERNGDTIHLAGLDQSKFGCEDIDSTLSSSVEADLTILMAHYPSTVMRLPPGRVDLQLSGHTHGGQIRFPYVGCIWPNDRIPRRMSRGLHSVGDVALHINPGIGVSLPLPLRVSCPAEVSVLSLEPALASEAPPASRSMTEIGQHDRAYNV